MHQAMMPPSCSGDTDVDDPAHDKRGLVSDEEEKLIHPMQAPLVSLLLLSSAKGSSSRFPPEPQALSLATLLAPGSLPSRSFESEPSPGHQQPCLQILFAAFRLPQECGRQFQLFFLGGLG